MLVGGTSERRRGGAPGQVGVVREGAEGMAMARAGSLVSKLDSKICYHRDAALEYMEI